MTTQNYFVIENGVITNSCVWDGNVESWTPPQGSVLIVNQEMPIKTWLLNDSKTEYVLTETIGFADIGFSYDGSIATTNQPKPELEIQPVVNGATTL